MTQQIRSAQRVIPKRPHVKKAAPARAPLSAAGVEVHWDPKGDYLRIGDECVVLIPKKARGQRWLLDLFQEAGWPDEVAGIRKKDVRKAHNSIHRLSRKLAGKKQTLLFCWNGTTTGICCFLTGFKE